MAAVLLLAAVVVVVGADLSSEPSASASANVPGHQQPVTNPPVPDSCGTDVVLVLDASGSISSSNAVDEVRDAGEAFLDALADTGSTASVLQFGSVSEQLAPNAEVTAGSLQPGGSFRQALDAYYDPKPPRPPGTVIYRYDGSGDPQSASNWDSNNSDQYTNWDQSLDQAGAAAAELIVYVTDGDPTAFDFNQPGDPFDGGPPPDVGVQTDRDQAMQTTLDRAVQEANQAKSAGSRILAVGVGSALGNTSSRNRLVQIAGPQVVDDADLADVTSINEVDVALVEEFDALAAFLRGVVSELCSPSLSIRKLAQTADERDVHPGAGMGHLGDAHRGRRHVHVDPARRRPRAGRLLREPGRPRRRGVPVVLHRRHRPRDLPVGTGSVGCRDVGRGHRDAPAGLRRGPTGSRPHRPG